MNSPVRRIRISRPHYLDVVGHARRNIGGLPREGGSTDRMAFGLLAGTFEGDAIVVQSVFPLSTNLRRADGYREVMDAVVDEHATRSETANTRRGWVADPREILGFERICDRNSWVNFGNYHTHRVAWPHDPLRDTCTELDRVLAEESGQWVFILSVVDPERPILRAFYEGRNEAEVPLRLDVEHAGHAVHGD